MDVLLACWLLLADDPAKSLDPTGYAGWVTAVTTSGVLTWLLCRHLPAKDAQINNIIGVKDAQLDKKDTQITNLLDDFAKERERDRQARHDQATTFNGTLNECYGEWRSENEKTRVAFDQRTKRMEDQFTGALNTVLTHCEKEVARIGEAILRSDLSSKGLKT